MSQAMQQVARISPEESRRRAESVCFARGNMRLEGVDIGPDMAALGERYISGEFTIDEYVQAALALAASFAPFER